MSLKEIITPRYDLVRKYYKYFLAGLIIRFIFAPWTGHFYDMPIFLDSGQKLANGLSPYTSYIHLGQTILWAIWTASSYLIAKLVFHSNLFAEIFFIKLPPIFVDLLLPIEIILLSGKFSGENLTRGKEKIILISILLNPYFIIVSSFWGMIDNLAFLLILISLELVIDNHIVVPIILTSISIGLKLYPVIFLPVLALSLYWTSKNIIKAFIFGISVTICFFFIAYAPFIIFPWNSAQITGVLTSQLSRYSGGLTIFGIITALSTGNRFAPTFYNLVNVLNNIWYLNYIWLITIVALSCYYLIHYRNLPDTLNEDFKTKEFKLFTLTINMAIIYFLAWSFEAKWVSEQNFTPLLCLLLIKYVFSPKDSQIEQQISRIFTILSIFLLVYLTFNAPIIGFFYLFINLQSLENQFLIWDTIRSLFMVPATIVIMIYGIKLLRDIKHESHHNTLQ